MTGVEQAREVHARAQLLQDGADLVVREELQVDRDQPLHATIGLRAVSSRSELP
jgi:hypothetical protein